MSGIENLPETVEAGSKVLGRADSVVLLAGSVEFGAGWAYWGEDQEAVVGTTVQCTCIAVKHFGDRMPGSSAAAIDGLEPGCPNSEAGDCLKRCLVGMVYILRAAAAIVVSPGALVIAVAAPVVSIHAMLAALEVAVADAGTAAVLVAATEVAIASIVAIELDFVAAAEAAVEKVVVAAAAAAAAAAAIVVELAVVAGGMAVAVVVTVVAATEAVAVVDVAAVGQSQAAAHGLIVEIGYSD